jgi:hypothetical protein
MNLHLLVINSDISFHFKFYEIMNRKAYEYLDNGKGFIDLEMFVKWWFCPVEELKTLVPKSPKQKDNGKIKESPPAEDKTKETK